MKSESLVSDEVKSEARDGSKRESRADEQGGVPYPMVGGSVLGEQSTIRNLSTSRSRVWRGRREHEEEKNGNAPAYEKFERACCTYYGEDDTQDDWVGRERAKERSGKVGTTEERETEFSCRSSKVDDLPAAP